MGMTAMQSAMMPKVNAAPEVVTFGMEENNKIIDVSGGKLLAINPTYDQLSRPMTGPIDPSTE